MPILWIGSSGRHGSGLGCLFSEPAGRHLALPSRIVSLLGCIAPTCVPHSAWDVQCVLQELCFFRPDHVGGGQEAGKRRGRPVEWLVYPDCVTTAALHQGWPVWSVRCTFRYFTERRQVHSANACGEAGAVLFFFTHSPWPILGSSSPHLPCAAAVLRWQMCFRWISLQGVATGARVPSPGIECFSNGFPPRRHRERG